MPASRSWPTGWCCNCERACERGHEPTARLGQAHSGRARPHFLSTPRKASPRRAPASRSWCRARRSRGRHGRSRRSADCRAAIAARRESPQRVIRIATHDDIVTRLKHEQREREAHRIASLKIRERGLGMKLARIEQTFDGSRLDVLFHRRRPRRLPRARARARRASSTRASRCARSASATKRR